MELTLEELKAEAKRQGYSLIKRQPYVKLNLCPTCGKKPGRWISLVGWFYRCDECGLQANSNKKDYEARKTWNSMVDDISRDKLGQ